MAATRRLQKELEDIRTSGLRSFRDILVDDTNILTWQGLIIPVSESVVCHLNAALNNFNPVMATVFYFGSNQYFIHYANTKPFISVEDNPPYNKGAFRIEINFPAEYPFKPPKINFKTKIYHPNIDEKGQVCLPIISAENWKPATKTDQVIQALVALVNDPEPEHPLRAEVAEEFLKDRKKFTKNAEEFTKKYSEKRPSVSE